VFNVSAGELLLTMPPLLFHSLELGWRGMSSAVV